MAVSLTGVLALQLWTCRGKLGLPFLDTRLHYSYDNAEFSFKARSGNRNGDLRSQFGVTINSYSRWGERVGKPAYYTDHPFLMKALFQQYARIVGTREWASRIFYLAVSFGIAAGLFTVILQTTGNLLASAAGSITLVSLPLFAVYQTCVKYETDGMLVSVWLFAALVGYLKAGARRTLVVYGILTGLAFAAHWTAALFVGVFAGYLSVALWRGRNPRVRRALLVTLAAAAAGLASLFAAVSYLQQSSRVAVDALVKAFTTRSAPIPAAAWWARQWVYFQKNFSEVLPWLALALALFLAVRWFAARRSRDEATASPERSEYLLLVFAAATLTVACVWQFTFRQGSFIHVYWQYWFCLPVTTVIAAAFASFATTPRRAAAATVACGALAAYLLSASAKAYSEVLGEQLGTPEDVGFLGSLREDSFRRMVFVPVTDTPLNPWFQGPLFEYYTDRPVVVATAANDLHPGDKALVLRYEQREKVAAGLSAWSRTKLANEKCGDRMCAYDVLSP